MKVHYQKEQFIDKSYWGLAFKRFFPAMLLQRCPVCLGSSVFKNYFELKDKCPNCSAVFERDKGSAILSAVISYFLVIILTLLSAIPILLNYGLFEGITFVFVGLVIIFIFVLHRPVKGLYLWILWCFGFVYPDRQNS